MTLIEALTSAAAGLDGTEASEPELGGIAWSVAGRPFAAASGAMAEFRLDRVVGRAALGTPDTSTSPRGPDWIAFGPRELDQFAIDRAVAWLGSAYRSVSRQGQ